MCRGYSLIIATYAPSLLRRALHESATIETEPVYFKWKPFYLVLFYNMQHSSKTCLDNSLKTATNPRSLMFTYVIEKQNLPCKFKILLRVHYTQRYSQNIQNYYN